MNLKILIRIENYFFFEIAERINKLKKTRAKEIHIRLFYFILCNLKTTQQYHYQKMKFKFKFFEMQTLKTNKMGE